MLGNSNRRAFVKAAVASGAFSSLPAVWSSCSAAEEVAKSPNDRWRVGAIGVRGRGGGIANRAKEFGDMVAVADVDRKVLGERGNNVGDGKAELYQDYRKLLERNDIDVVTIGTPDHWHTKILIDAMHAGKDVYCEKPLTLTIDEGKKICEVAKQTGRVVQVGTQQRSEFDQRFLTAVAMVRDGRVGKLSRVVCATGTAPTGGPFDKITPPKELDWEMWLGQAPKVDYIPERCHHDFRWWFEYSGGKMTDWGAHHVDIGQWAMGMHETGPSSVEMVSRELPVDFSASGMPTVDDRFNTANAFHLRCRFPGDVDLEIRSDASELGFNNGVLFEGDGGRFFVNRGKLTGAPVEALKDNPISDEQLVALRHGKPLTSHMKNFYLCAGDRSMPVSDVFSHHRTLTTCHLANIALRLGRSLKWDAANEQVIDDPQANSLQSREQRKGYEIVS